MSLEVAAVDGLPAPEGHRHFHLAQIQEAFAAAEDKRTSGTIKVMMHP